MVLFMNPLEPLWVHPCIPITPRPNYSVDRCSNGDEPDSDTTTSLNSTKS